MNGQDFRHGPTDGPRRIRTLEMAAPLDSRTGTKSNPMESSTQALENPRGEEEEEQRILQFLDSIDSYLSLFDSLSFSLRQVSSFSYFFIDSLSSSLIIRSIRSWVLFILLLVTETCTNCVF